VKSLGEVWVVLEICDKPRKHASADRLREHGREPHEESADVLASRPGLFGRRDRFGACEIRLEHEFRARPPPPIDRLFADPGAGRDALDCQLAVTALDQELLRRVDDRLMRALASAPPPLSSRFRHRTYCSS